MRGRVGNYFITSAYRKEHWRAETSNLSSRCVGGALPLGCNLPQESQGRRDSRRGDKDLCLWEKGNITKDAYMAEWVHIRSPGPEGSHGRGGLARIVAVGGVEIVWLPWIPVTSS